MSRLHLLLAATTALVVGGCGAGTEAPGRREPQRASTESEIEWFVDRAQAAGLDFVHFNGMSGGFYQPEIMAPGVGLFDYDNDGDLDVYLVQGQMLGTGKTVSQAVVPPKAPLPLRGRLYRNELLIDADGVRTLRFTDVTGQSGLDAREYGMGVAAGDYDNDGCVDLYLTNFGPNQLFRNNCDGTFTDASRTSGVAGDGWSVPAAFVDFDRDGWLDLFVGHYLAYSLDRHVNCFTDSRLPDYCPPERYRAEPDRLYRNRRNGTFADVTVSSGVARAFGPALGVATADFNGDKWIDIFVANDQKENQLWINQGDGTFKDLALGSGAALSATGSATANMGVDAGDFDNDGDEDLIVTELTGQGSSLYVNDGTGLFEEESARTGIRLMTLPYTGFGTGWFDYDNDGWLDVLAVNGFVTQNLDTLGPGNPFPLQQPNLLIRNLGMGKFENVTHRAGAVFRLSEVGRGTAFGDIDNDGDVDVVVTNAAGPVRLLLNQVGNRQHWLGLRLVGADGRRDMLGARVAVIRSEGPTLWRRARADGSYASANDPRVVVGLGRSTAVRAIQVTWPSGRVEEWSDVAVDRYTIVREGSGRAVNPDR
jgi:enediyne biosynthesis protein E4